jgi:hypothetical protein
MFEYFTTGSGGGSGRRDAAWLAVELLGALYNATTMPAGWIKCLERHLTGSFR